MSGDVSLRAPIGTAAAGAREQGKGSRVPREHPPYAPYRTEGVWRDLGENVPLGDVVFPARVTDRHLYHTRTCIERSPATTPTPGVTSSRTRCA